MHVVKSLAEHRCRETVKVLEHLLELGRRGEIVGMAVSVATADGQEEIVFTDSYRRNPSKAVGAAMRMSWRLTQLQDELDARQG